MSAQDKNTEALLELADILDLAATKIRTTLKGSGVKAQAKLAYDVAKISWQERTGDKGPFQIAEKSKNAQSSDYVALDAELQNKEKGSFIAGMFYWRFTGGDAIGRKKLQGGK
jgi:hypothetical protein